MFKRRRAHELKALAQAGYLKEESQGGANQLGTGLASCGREGDTTSENNNNNHFSENT
jgi:hypothetical protein